MSQVHHSAICVRDVETSLRFWRDGLGFAVLMDQNFAGDWPGLFGAPTTSLRSIFLGDPADPAAGIVELVDIGSVPGPAEGDGARLGFLLLSLFTDVEAALERLAELGFAAAPRRIEASGVKMATVRDPDGVVVELIDAPAAANVRRLGGSRNRPADADVSGP